LGQIPPFCSAKPDAPLCIVGDKPVVTYTVPAGILGGKESSSVSLLLVTAATVGGAPGCLMQWAQTGMPPTDCVVATKQVTVSNRPDALRNHNPTLSGLDMNGVAMPVVGGPEVAPGSDNPLTLHWPASDAEPEPVMGADGGTGGTETLLFSWFTTADGVIQYARTDTTNPDNTFGAPTPIADSGGPLGQAITLWVVVRDDRGGVGWIQRQVYVNETPPDAGPAD
jgi:hypothetical protein